jgi:PKD repeat protein
MVRTAKAVLFALLAVTLPSCGNGRGGSSSPNPSIAAPVAAFSFSPASPIVNQVVQFTDTSTGTPTSWNWIFGDGASSSAKNPTHTYASPGAFRVSFTASNAGGSSSVIRAVDIAAAPLKGDFLGTILLGAPTTNSVKLNILSADQSGTISVQYGTASGKFDYQTPAATLSADVPLQIALTGLDSDTTYYYRVYYDASGGTGSGPTDLHTFHTARPANSTFTFTVQSDSHLDENSDLNLYHKTLSNILADAPDFHIDLGDTFMCEKHSAPMTATVQTARDQATVNARYEYERGNFGMVSPSVPLFLVNGNHEGEAGSFVNGTAVNGTAENLAVWTTRARQQYYLNPAPDSFYGGDPTAESFVGQRASWYSWHWGDALFVVLDPYWNTKTKGGTDGWNMTLGQDQYLWLRGTLAASPAKYKFIFIHSLVGGLDGQYRGGIEVAPYFEWGGKNLDGTDGFSTKRPGWGMPIHPMLKQYGVTAVFHGHDHLYAQQNLDGIAYQEVPQPSARNTSNGPALAAQYHYTAGTILSSSGHLRVLVSPSGVQVQYVRAWLPENETATRKNGQIDDSWTVTPTAAPPAASFALTPAAPLAGQSVQFTDSSSGSPPSRIWNFGDGTSSSAQNPAHGYASPASAGNTFVKRDLHITNY